MKDKDSNKSFATTRKFVEAFISSLSLPEADKEEIKTQWKAHAPKLRSQLKKNASGAPKRLVSKYLYFCREERTKIFAEHPGITIKDCTCELGRRWSEFKKNPDPERMKELTELFEKDKVRYDTEKAGFAPQKRPMPKSAYLIFCQEQRRLSDPKIGLKELGSLWTEVKQNPEQLAKYKLLADNYAKS